MHVIRYSTESLYLYEKFMEKVMHVICVKAMEGLTKDDLCGHRILSFSNFIK